MVIVLYASLLNLMLFSMLCDLQLPQYVDPLY